MRWRSGLLTACSALLLAGCGGGGHSTSPPPKPPRIPAGVATRLATEADRIAAQVPGTCTGRDAAARFRSDVITSIGQVPARYREQLTSAANDLAARFATCTAPPAEHGHGEKQGHGKKHGHGDEQGNGNGDENG